VLAANDCGFDTSAGWGRVAPDVVWAKLRTLRDGARLASARLFWFSDAQFFVSGLKWPGGASLLSTRSFAAACGSSSSWGWKLRAIAVAA